MNTDYILTPRTKDIIISKLTKLIILIIIKLNGFKYAEETNTS